MGGSYNADADVIDPKIDPLLVVATKRLYTTVDEMVFRTDRVTTNPKDPTPLNGNNVKPITGGFYRSANLHSVWDSGIIKNAEGDDGWRAYADNLKDAITPADQASWIASGSVDWAQESYLITTGPDVRYCEWDADSCNALPGGRKLLESYQDEFADEVEVRLQKAGVRLAEQIRKSLHGQ